MQPKSQYTPTNQIEFTTPLRQVNETKYSPDSPKMYNTSRSYRTLLLNKSSNEEGESKKTNTGTQRIQVGVTQTPQYYINSSVKRTFHPYIRFSRPNRVNGYNYIGERNLHQGVDIDSVAQRLGHSTSSPHRRVGLYTLLLIYVRYRLCSYAALI